MSDSSQKPNLSKNLKEAAAIKAEMTGLLRELEQAATARTPEKPGAWRHHPTEWAAKHLA